MTSLAPAASSAPRLVLADRVFDRSLLMDAVLVLSGTALVTILAQLAVPLQPVPITGQTLAVLLVGATLGWKRGGLALVLYAALGLAGLPVFAPEDDGSHVVGATAIFGATGGYILGFIPAAILVGWLSERAWDRKILKALATFAAGTLVVFAVGLPWLAVALGTDLATTLQYGLWPFLLGGAIKAAIAAGLLPLGWRLADRVKNSRADGTEG
jgi:biotin transport system substrate-specific component